MGELSLLRRLTRSRARYALFIVPFAFWAFGIWAATTPQFQNLVSNLPSKSLDVSAKLGDTFGAFSALMAAVAAVGAILALYEQRAAVQRQMFTATFVGMMERLQHTVQDTDYFVVKSVRRGEYVDQTIEKSQSGRNAFYEFSQELRLYIEANLRPDMNYQEKVGLILMLYTDFYSENKDSLGHFFRQVYHIAKFIDDSDDQEAERFSKLLRASLTNAQLLLIAYNSICGEGRVKFCHLISDQSLLHNLSFEKDDLGRLERAIIVDRLSLRSLESDTHHSDRLDATYLAVERMNAAAKEQFKCYLIRNQMSTNLGISWKAD